MPRRERYIITTYPDAWEWETATLAEAMDVVDAQRRGGVKVKLEHATTVACWVDGQRHEEE